jgi:SAM-dependent methyltransferase
MKLILGNHWDKAPEGWTILKEEDQDMTKIFKWEDSSIEAIFSEHCVEHLTLEGAINYFKESLRVLKHGGILRTVCPFIDKMIHFKNDAIGKHYSDVQTRNYYPNEDAALKELGLEGIREEPIMFMMDSLFKGHNHRMIWTSGMMKKVLQKVGFSQVNIVQPGVSLFEEETELERVIRGVNPEYCLKEFNVTHYDPESIVIEAKK